MDLSWASSLFPRLGSNDDCEGIAFSLQCSFMSTFKLDSLFADSGRFFCLAGGYLHKNIDLMGWFTFLNF